MTKRLFALALVVCMLLTCAACSGSAPEATPADQPQAEAPADAPKLDVPDASDPFAEHVTFTMNTTSDPPAADDALWQFYTDKFNFDVE